MFHEWSLIVPSFLSFFVSSRRRHTSLVGDWSSDVCSSDLEAAAVARLPEIHYSSIWMGVAARLEYEGTRTQPLVVYGADARFMEILGGGIPVGRPFTVSEERGGDPVVVLEHDAAERVFGRVDPIGRTVRLAGQPMRVVGTWQRPKNIFEPPGQ